MNNIRKIVDCHLCICAIIFNSHNISFKVSRNRLFAAYEIKKKYILLTKDVTDGEETHKKNMMGVY